MDEIDEVLITHDPLDVNSAFMKATLPSTGATSLFVGTTRDNFDGKKVVKLEYEAYEPMALKEMKRLCEEIRAKWEVSKIVIQHRLGEVEITQPSVVIAVSAPHRKESLEAVNFGIERLKEKVPIWKKEKYEEGGEVWKENRECCWSNKERRRRRRLPVDNRKIVVQVSKQELDKRIQAFILSKQDKQNEYISKDCSDRINGDTSGSARTDAKVRGTKRKLAEISHSPITVDDKLKGSCQPEPLEKRLREIESKIYPEYKPVPRDIYERLKVLETRILYLESLSPEYSPILGEERLSDSSLKTIVSCASLMEQARRPEEVNENSEDVMSEDNVSKKPKNKST